MYATIHRFRRRPDEESPESGRDLLTALLDGRSPAGACVLSRLDGGDVDVFALWDDEDEARAAVTRAGDHALESAVFTVVDTEPGADPAGTPRFAQLVWLNGGGDAHRADAAIRAGRERIAPATRDVEGVVGTYVLRATDHRMVVITLVTGVETLEVLRGAVLGTELLPWEDPTQLTDPDRIAIGRVLGAQLPIGVRS